ncbi:MAG: General stress protein 69 [Firmicutes bacterium]|nr:General stress protein 69 [Bacillota bacterium]
MQYRPFGQLGFNVSTLGFGCMRLPLLEATPSAHGNVAEEARIDEPLATAMLRFAIDQGVNYVDTAYNYHGGQSEWVVGRALANGYREKVKLATKLPCWLAKEPADFDRLLDEQLRKLNVSHVDFYLLHALRGESWKKVKALGVLDFLTRAVADGRIKYPAFSIHDEFPVFKEILDAYAWAMCQIQLNYMDEDYQVGLGGLQYAGHKGVPVVIMEPLRGGKLAQEPPEKVKQVWKQAKKKRTPAEWAFRWVCDFPETTVVLSGMSTMEQVRENLKIFDGCKPPCLDLQEGFLVDKVKQIYRQRMAIGCTQCGYCMPCPANVNIPHILDLYNDYAMFGSPAGAFRDAAQCVQCGKCEAECPQHLPIIKALREAHQALQG